MLAGRKEIAGQLDESEYLGSDANAGQSFDLEGLKGLLFQLPVFMHLWFLWFLCWLVAAFLIYTPIAKALKIENAAAVASLFAHQSVVANSADHAAAVVHGSQEALDRILQLA